MTTTTTALPEFSITIIGNDRGAPAGKLADAEIHFNIGVLSGLKLLGFAIWEQRNGSGKNVTFPARAYSVNGERRSFALLRPSMDVSAQANVRDIILAAYAAWEKAQEAARVEHEDVSAAYNSGAFAGRE